MPAAPSPSLPAPPLDIERAASLVAGLDRDALLWLSGYAAGLAGPGAVPAPPQAVEAASAGSQAAQAPRISIVFGSQTGNARDVAQALADRLSSAGRRVRLLNALDYPLRELATETHLLVVTSTQGDGDPPEDAAGFVEHLAGRRAPALKGLRFAVLGLGDSSYPKFCETARQLDARLAELGGERWLPLAEADLDFQDAASAWSGAVESASSALVDAVATATVTPLRPAVQAAVHDASQPFLAEVLENQRITGRGSDRDVRHIELSLSGSGIAYQPGDSVALRPLNPAPLVEELLTLAALDGDTVVEAGDAALPLRRWLGERLELNRLSRPVLEAAASHAPALATWLAEASRDAVVDLLANHTVVDLLHRWPAPLDAAALVAMLRPLAHRSYSIASAAALVGEEVHLTVAREHWRHGDRDRVGAASDWLAGLEPGAQVPLWLEPNPRFRLPADPGRDIIMVGPGTGVAPFRGFVQAREAAGAGGRNWLFFGNRHARTDFLYQLEWQAALRSGALHRLDLAFSRDRPGDGRTYVQHRLAERGAEVFAWLQDGAHFYVCGDATRMARDVEQALLALAARHGGLDAEGAREWLAELRQQGRYARDVY